MKRYLLIIILLAAAGCRTTYLPTPAYQKPPEYSIIYIIHGDSDYLYHTIDGSSHQSDKHVLKEAKQTARLAKHGEVFIFYQKPETKILWFFPRKDRRFYYYRNGRLIHKQRYSPHSKKYSFVTEAKLYKRYSENLNSAHIPRVFLYMGHEIPVKFSYPYYLSRPDARFDTHSFVQGVKSFLHGAHATFSLIVISTCNNGTPAMVQKLTPYTHYILASPKNLHLSQINTEQLSILLEHGNSVAQTADSMATHTFKRLKEFLETDITLSLYNTNQTKRYLPRLAQKYRKYLQSLSPSDLLEENTDCASLRFFHAPKVNNGIKVWYQPSPFGKKTETDMSFSGWGCKQ